MRQLRETTTFQRLSTKVFDFTLMIAQHFTVPLSSQKKILTGTKLDVLAGENRYQKKVRERAIYVY